MVKKITESDIIEIYLNNYNKNYYLEEIASKLEKPHQTIKPHLNKLIEKNILIENKKRNIKEYGLNLNNKKIIDYLVISEKKKTLKKIEKEKILDLLYNRLENFFNNNTFIIFGSSVEEIQKKSDIDLLIIGKKNVSEEIKKFQNTYNKKIHKIQVNKLNDLNPTIIKEIYKKHLIFNNTEKIIKFFKELYEKNKLV